MSNGRILIVDDDPKVRTLLRRCLEGEGFDVSEAKDGQKCASAWSMRPSP